jgi:hypothetical protein
MCLHLDDYATKAQFYLKTLCSVVPNRRTGSSSNREATDFFADTIRPFGHEIDATPIDRLWYGLLRSEWQDSVADKPAK